MMQLHDDLRSPKDESFHELLAQVASMYYDQELTQEAIGLELGLSRIKISRLLKQARENEVVQININWPTARARGVEQELQRRFNLKEALVLKSPAQKNPPSLARLGQLGARYLERILEDGMTLAVCLGSSTYAVIDAISPNLRARIRVAQAMGSMPFTMRDLDSAALTRQLAQKLGGEAFYLSSPLIADSIEAAEVLRRQRDIEVTLAIARQSDVALLGIGNFDPARSAFARDGSITPDELAALTAAGAVGDVGGQIYTCTGQLHPCEYNQRVIGITFEDLFQIPTTMAVAMGQDKIAAILGALRTCTIKVLCTDELTALGVLELEQSCPA